MTDGARLDIATPQDYLVIEDNATLADFVAVLGRCPVVAVDIESNSLHHYTERVSLIQVTGRDGDGVCHHAVIDPLADVEVPMLGPLLADPEVVVVFHGADFDVVSLKRDYGFTINNIYDTMIAARAAGIERFGLADLVQRYYGVTLNKKFQKHDWSERPLGKDALDYAHLDTRYLPEIMDELKRLVLEGGRDDLVAEECVLIESRNWAPRVAPEEAFLTVKGANRLPEDAQRVLREVHAWREKVAEKRDWPPFKVMGTDLLLAIASAAPDTAQALEHIAGSRNRMVRRYGPELIEAVAAGKATTDKLPRLRNAKGRRYTREDDLLFNRLREWRNAQAEREAVEPSMVVGNQVLKEISAMRPRDEAALAAVPAIRRWQARRYAAALTAQVAAFEADEAGGANAGA